ncbi:MAG TPA: hypothetical protein VHM90_12800, partial [Phycisphaerae bacterium]|nr:hypothetical protein [Phycisphaerae bacterium]
EAAEIIHRVVPAAVIKVIPFDGDRRNYKVRFDKAARDLRFTPAWGLKQGILQVSDAIRVGRIKSYRDPLYSNVVFLRNNGVGALIINDGADDLEKMIAPELPEERSRA